MSLTVQQLLTDAKRLSGRLRDHDASADNVISNAQEVLKAVDAMRQYQEDIDNLNSIAHNRPRAQLVLGKLSSKLYAISSARYYSKHTNSMFHYHSVIILGIQQENRHIRQLQHENKELRAALEEHQNAIELIMSKYRQHITSLVHSSKLDNNAINEQKSLVRSSANEILIICTSIEITRG